MQWTRDLSLLLALSGQNFDGAKDLEKNVLICGSSTLPLDKIQVHPGHCYLRAKHGETTRGLLNNRKCVALKGHYVFSSLT